MKHILFLFICLGSLQTLAAVSQSTAEVRGHAFKEPLMATLSLEVPDLGIDLSSKNGGSMTSFKPNALAYIGVGLDYGNVGFTVATKLPGTEEDPQKKGSTDNFDLGLRHSWISDHVDAYFEDYKGFYVDQTANDQGVYQTRPDLSLQHIGFTYLHAFNPDFNLSGVDDHRIGKITQGGSVIASATFDQVVLNANSPLIGVADLSNYGEEGTITNGRFMTGALSAGYTYVWPWPKDLLSLNILVGAGPQWQWLTEDTGDRFRIVSEINSDGALSYAHQIDSWRLGITARYSYKNSDLGSVQLSSHVGSGMAFVQNQF